MNKHDMTAFEFTSIPVYFKVEIKLSAFSELIMPSSVYNWGI